MRKPFQIFMLLMLALVFSCQEDDDDLTPFVNDRDKFLGSWSVNDETCQKSRYTVTISADPSNSIQVLLSNFGFSQSAQPDTAIVAGTTITLPRQENSEKWFITGSGKFQDNKINWSYTLEISGDLLSCTATYRK
ncbi:MAG: hypothetical protein KKA81_05940 [Bacteroidetes bacterium]|nr:hypothetical protein [Bacteroidota bacterium]